jgi:hypothetical protein
MLETQDKVSILQTETLKEEINRIIINARFLEGEILQLEKIIFLDEEEKDGFIIKNYNKLQNKIEKIKKDHEKKADKKSKHNIKNIWGDEYGK